jgi:2-methylcitrate dehydratase PrpD
LGKPFEILNTYFKVRCALIHPALDALKAIMDENGIDIHGIERIDVHTYSVAYQLTGRNREARREMDAKFSLPLSSGLMCVYGKAGVEQYSMECLENPLVRRIAEKVTVAVDPERDEVYPRERSSRVDVVTSKGTFSHEVPFQKETLRILSRMRTEGEFSQNARRF